MALDLTNTGEELGGLRKMLQDLLAPELGSVKTMLDSLHEGQQQIRQDMLQLRQDMHESQQQLRQDMRESQQQLRQDMREAQQQLREDMQLQRQDMKEGFGLVREEIKLAETRSLRAIELNSNELKALIKASDAERRLAEAERRNTELERRLAESGKHQPLSA